MHAKPRTTHLHGARIALACIAAAALASCARQVKPEAAPFDHTYPAWGRVLARCATPKGFRYDIVSQFQADLDRQSEEIREITPRIYKGFTREERLALLINVHNLSAVRRVAARYPVKSIEQTESLGSALNAKEIRLAGRRWSLASLRGEIMGKRFYESRAIFALNWASKGCGALPPAPVTPFNLRAMLDRQAQAFVRDTSLCRYDRKEKVYHASPLLRQYRDDIERDFTSLWKFLERYAPADDALRISQLPPKLEWNEFDRSLNDYVELLNEPANP